MARNITLLRRRLGLDKARDVLSFVCVAGPEFVKQGYPGLWYGATQRVLTPPEVVALFADEPRWLATIAASGTKDGF
jgi:hypothetical protein